MKKVAVFDIDGTIYRDILHFDLAELLLPFMVSNEELDAVKEAKKHWKTRSSGNESFWHYNQMMVDTFDGSFRGLELSKLEWAVDTLMKTKANYLYHYTSSLAQKLKQDGYILITISGSMKHIVEPFAKNLGFDYAIGAEFEIIDGKFTGKSLSKSHQGKEKILATLLETHGLSLEGSYGIGDTHRDISLLSAVDNPIAFNPNAALYDKAIENGWKIVVERKNMIYESLPQSDGQLLTKAFATHGGTHNEQKH